jgi:hypothetical protein
MSPSVAAVSAVFDVVVTDAPDWRDPSLERSRADRTIRVADRQRSDTREARFREGNRARAASPCSDDASERNADVKSTGPCIGEQIVDEAPVVRVSAA